MQPPRLPEYENSRIACVILAKNEAKTIGDVVKGAAGFAHEVVVMDGHSTDETAVIARSAGARVYCDPGKGKGSAIRQSLQLIDTEVVVFMDADGSHQPADISKLVLPI